MTRETPSNPHPVVELIALIRRHYGIDFSGGLLASFHDALAQEGSTQLAAAEGLLRGGLPRLSAFVGRAANGETHFMRHPAQFYELGWLLAQGGFDRSPSFIRIWSAGCSSGEETVSLAIVLGEAATWLRDDHLSILGTDLSVESLDRARTGCYPPWSFRSVSEQTLRSYFRPCALGHEVLPALRRRILYRIHNMMEGPPEPMPFDVVVCRNVLIYFDPPAFKRAIEVLSSAVAPGGYLVLGPTEGAAVTLAGFRAVDRQGVVLYQKERPGHETSPPPQRVTWPMAPPTAAVLSAPSPSSPPAAALPASPPRAPPDLEVLLADARHKANSGQLDEAWRACDALRRGFHGAPEVLVLCAMVALERRELERAGRALDDIRRAGVVDGPAAVYPLYLRGRLLQAQGDRGAARDCLRGALETMQSCEDDEPITYAGELTAGTLAAAIGAILATLGGSRANG